MIQTFSNNGNVPTIAALDGTASTGPDSLDTKQIRGLSVTATSAELVTAIGGSGAGGLVAGLAGGVTITTITSSTEAVVSNGTNAQIGSGAVEAGGDGGVFSLALNDVQSYALRAGAGAVGVAGAVSSWTVGTDFNSSYGDTDKSDKTSPSTCTRPPAPAPSAWVPPVARWRWPISGSS